MKKEKKGKNINENEISNNFQGLYDYLTSTNIKDKIKHPLFLCVHFSSCVKLYYNKKLISENVFKFYYVFTNKFLIK